MNTTGKVCKDCFFGIMMENGVTCECHANKPVSSGKFPPVRPNDYCGYWTDPKNLTRPFSYLPPLPPPIMDEQSDDGKFVAPQYYPSYHFWKDDEVGKKQRKSKRKGAK